MSAYQDLPFSQACENNKGPILAELTQAFAGCAAILEIGSGTGQHGVYFARQLPHLHWYCSDQPHYHEGIKAWQSHQPSPNLHPPIPFTIGQDPWPQLPQHLPPIDGVFSANTAHIMQPNEARSMMAMIAKNLPKMGVFCQYGPFKIDGGYTSDSNAAFDQGLLAQGYGGIRDIDELKDWGRGLRLVAQHALPANNLLLVWHKTP